MAEDEEKEKSDYCDSWYVPYSIWYDPSEYLQEQSLEEVLDATLCPLLAPLSAHERGRALIQCIEHALVPFPDTWDCVVRSGMRITLENADRRDILIAALNATIDTDSQMELYRARKEEDEQQSFLVMIGLDDSAWEHQYVYNDTAVGKDAQWIVRIEEALTAFAKLLPA